MNALDSFFYMIYGDNKISRGIIFTATAIGTIIALPFVVAYFLGPYLWLAGMIFYGLHDSLTMILMWNMMFIVVYTLMNIDYDKQLERFDEDLDVTTNNFIMATLIK